MHKEIKKKKFYMGHYLLPGGPESSSSCLLSENMKIKKCKTVIRSVVVYGWETWSLTLMEENKDECLRE